MPIANSGMILNAVIGAAINVPVVKSDEIPANAIPVKRSLIYL